MNNVMVAYNIVYVVITAIGVSLFGLIFLSTRRKAREKPMNVSSWKKRENVWFIVVVLALAGAVAETIFKTPWQADARADRQVVTVTGQQFGFVFSSQDFKAGTQVEFQLKSKDVTHAFAIYGPTGVFIAQGQMIPGYTNKVRVNLEKPGTYEIRCFEYCGIGHHLMKTQIEVK